MSSSAEKLLELMEEWSAKESGSLMEQRGGDQFWGRHVEAVEALLDTDRAVAALDNGHVATVWSKVAPRLQRCIFAVRFQESWTAGTTSTHQFLSADSLELLRGIVGALTVGEDGLGKAPELQGLRDTAARLRSDIASAPDLSAEEQAYLLRLVARLQEALDEVHVFGLLDIRRHIDELIGSLYRLYVAKDEPEEAHNLIKLAKRLGKGFNDFINSPIVSAIAGGIVGNMLQITSG